MTHCGNTIRILNTNESMHKWNSRGFSDPLNTPKLAYNVPTSMLFYTITEITENWKIPTNGPESIISCVSNVSLFFIHCLSKG